MLSYVTITLSVFLKFRTFLCSLKEVKKIHCNFIVKSQYLSEKNGPALVFSTLLIHPLQSSKYKADVFSLYALFLKYCVAWIIFLVKTIWFIAFYVFLTLIKHDERRASDSIKSKSWKINFIIDFIIVYESYVLALQSCN